MSDATYIPAFPAPSSAAHPGVSLRDWFAANALQGIIAKGLEVRGDKALTQEERDQEMVSRAFGLADQMMAKAQLPPGSTANPASSVPIASSVAIGANHRAVPASPKFTTIFV